MKHDIWPDKQVEESAIYKEGYDSGLDGATQGDSPYLAPDCIAADHPDHIEWERGRADGEKAL